MPSNITPGMIEAARSAYNANTPTIIPRGGKLAHETKLMHTILAAALSAQPVDDEPFMYGIMCPDGTAYMDEICVDTHDDGTLRDVIEDQGLKGHTVVPLYVAPPAPTGDGWRPIETAPKDGTRILFWDQDCEERAVIGAYLHGRWWPEGEDNVKVAPRGWMPLPAAPTPPKEGGE